VVLISNIKKLGKKPSKLSKILGIVEKENQKKY